jgi:DNA-binding IscR family transcriptional regulator
MLARRPDAITLLDALVVLEGPLLPSEPSREDLSPTQPDDYALIDIVWEELRGRIEQILVETTLDDLCQRKRQQSGDVMYYI